MGNSAVDLGESAISFPNPKPAHFDAISFARSLVCCFEKLSWTPRTPLSALIGHLPLSVGAVRGSVDSFLGDLAVDRTLS